MPNILKKTDPMRLLKSLRVMRIIVFAVFFLFMNFSFVNAQNEFDIPFQKHEIQSVFVEISQAAEVKKSDVTLLLGSQYSKAFTSSSEGKIYINPDYLIDGHGEYSWKAIGIMAHELGHIVNRDIIKDNNSNLLKRSMELNADFFAGKLLKKLGADQDEVLSVLDDVKYDAFERLEYPTVEVRKAAMFNGWKGTPKYIESTYIDLRDGYEYPTLRVGSQEWYTTPSVYAPKYANSYVHPMFVDFELPPRMYSWELAKSVCPEADGWRLPTKDDVDALILAAGGFYTIELFNHSSNTHEKITLGHYEEEDEELWIGNSQTGVSQLQTLGYKDYTVFRKYFPFIGRTGLVPYFKHQFSDIKNAQLKTVSVGNDEEIIEGTGYRYIYSRKVNVNAQPIFFNTHLCAEDSYDEIIYWDSDMQLDLDSLIRIENHDFDHPSERITDDGWMTYCDDSVKSGSEYQYFFTHYWTSTPYRTVIDSNHIDHELNLVWYFYLERDDQLDINPFLSLEPMGYSLFRGNHSNKNGSEFGDIKYCLCVRND